MSLPSCKSRKPAHEVPYPFVGANCNPDPNVHDPLPKDASLAQAREPWDKASLGSCEDRKPAHVVAYPYVGANCDADKPETNK